MVEYLAMEVFLSPHFSKVLATFLVLGDVSVFNVSFYFAATTICVFVFDFLFYNVVVQSYCWEK